MFKKGLTLTGTILLALGIWLALSVFLLPPETMVQAAPPPGCIRVDQDVSTDTTWDAPCYEIMTTTVTIIPGAVLTIAPPASGTAVYFDTGARLQVEGNLQVLGTDSRPITFTACRKSLRRARAVVGHPLWDRQRSEPHPTRARRIRLHRHCSQRINVAG